MRRNTLISVILAVPAIVIVGLFCLRAYSDHLRQTAAERMKSAGFKALISPFELEPIQTVGGRRVRLNVIVCNTGNEVWPAGGKVALGLFDRRLKDILTGREGHGNNPLSAVKDQLRFRPEKEVIPSRTFTPQVEFTAPVRPGRYLMRLQMVDESQTGEDGQPAKGRWFGDILRFELDVSSAAGVPPAA